MTEKSPVLPSALTNVSGPVKLEPALRALPLAFSRAAPLDVAFRRRYIPSDSDSAGSVTETEAPSATSTVGLVSPRFEVARAGCDATAAGRVPSAHAATAHARAAPPASFSR